MLEPATYMYLLSRLAYNVQARIAAVEASVLAAAE